MNDIKAAPREVEIGAKLVIVTLILMLLVVVALVFAAFALRGAVHKGQQALDEGAAQRAVLVAQGEQIKSLVEQIDSCTSEDGDCAKRQKAGTATVATAITFCTNNIGPDGTAADAFRCISTFALPK